MRNSAGSNGIVFYLIYLTELRAENLSLYSLYMVLNINASYEGK
jgi:YesN/AraC family two-component response regulator